MTIREMRMKGKNIRGNSSQRSLSYSPHSMCMCAPKDISLNVIFSSNRWSSDIANASVQSEHSGGMGVFNRIDLFANNVLRNNERRLQGTSSSSRMKSQFNASLFSAYLRSRPAQPPFPTYFTQSNACTIQRFCSVANRAASDPLLRNMNTTTPTNVQRTLMDSRLGVANRFADLVKRETSGV